MRSTLSTIHHFKISPQAQHYSLLCGIIFGNVELKAHTISKFKSFRAVCCRCLNNNFQFLNNIIYIFTLFHPHVFSKYTNNVTRNFLPNGPLDILPFFCKKKSLECIYTQNIIKEIILMSYIIGLPLKIEGYINRFHFSHSNFTTLMCPFFVKCPCNKLTIQIVPTCLHRH